MVAFYVGGFPIYWYGIAYLLSFLFAYIFFLFLVRKKVFLLSLPQFHAFLSSSFEDLLLWVFVGVLLGGRLGHVFIYDFSYYFLHPLKIFAFREGGMSFIGGILGTFFSLFLFFLRKRYSWKMFFSFLDVLFIPLGFGILLGRIANFLNQELYGIVVPAGGWGLSSSLFTFAQKTHLFHVYSLIDSFLRVNTNFLAIFLEGFLLIVFQSILAYRTWGFFSASSSASVPSQKSFSPGYGVSFFLLWYSFVRFLLEYLRYDSQQELLGWFSKSQWFFLGFFLIGVYLFWRRYQIK